MHVEKSDRGFGHLMHEGYPPSEPVRLASQSSCIGDYEDSFDRPGSSFLWIGDNHHLNREEVEEFVGYLRRWLSVGSLMPCPVTEPQPAA